MKRNIMSMAAVLALGTLFLAYSSTAAVVAGSEDFESYSTGTWVASNAPAANPVWDAGTLSVDVVDSGTSNGNELVVGVNLSNQWSSGVQFDLNMSGNESRNLADYTLEMYISFDPATVDNLTNGAFEVTIENTNDTTQTSWIPLGNLDPDGYNLAKTNGHTFSFPMNTTWIHWSKTKAVDPSIPSWHMHFLAGNTLAANDKPINFTIDNIVVNYTPPAFLNPTGSPVGLTTTTGPTLTGTVIDGTSEVETMMLYLDGSLVASNDTYAGGSTTNSISFITTNLLAGTHEGAVIATDASTNSLYHSWTFRVPEARPAPTTNALALYNINFEGSTNTAAGGIYPVANGTVAAAPSLGSNNWNNIMYYNPWWFFYQPFSISEASGGVGTITNSITYDCLTTSTNVQMYAPWSWGSGQDAFTPAAAGTMWAIALGAPEADMDFELSNLNMAVPYDLYIYFEDPTSAGPVATTYTLTTGETLYDPVITLDAYQVNGYGYVENTNYVVFTEITPIGGKIDLHVTGSTGGGISAMQLVARQPDASVVPNVQSIAQTNGMLNLSWTSEDYISYKILSKGALSDASWNMVSNAIPSEGATTSASVPASANAAFFRIESN